MSAVNGSSDNYGTTLDDSATLEPEPPIYSRKSLQSRGIPPARVKLGLAVVSERPSKVNGSLVAPPRVRDIRISSSPARGDTYARGETIQVGVEFDRAVTVSGTPRVALTIGAQTRRAAYSSSWEEYVHLSYTVRKDDRDEDGISIPANSLSLDRGSITAIDGRTDAQLSHRAVSADPARKVDGSQATP